MRNIIISFGEFICRRRIFIDDAIPLAYIIRLGFVYLIMMFRSLRNIFYLRMCPFRTFIGRGVELYCKSKITLEPGVRLGNYVHLNGLGRKGIYVGSGTSIGAYTRLICSGSISNIGEYIEIGAKVGIGEFSRIGGSGGVTIGANTIIGQFFSAHPENHNFENNDILIREQGTLRNPIAIGENCWIGAKVTLLAGVTIGEGCVIAAGAVVTKDMPPHSLVGGVPAKVIRRYR
jgi:acetyltransferase-like isoleucine patch superfamily enzyme